MSEIPVRPHPRRLVDWINPTGAKKVHSLVDKVYKQKNLEIAWERVRANRGSGGVDGPTLEQFAAELGQQLGRLQRELQEETCQPQPVRQVQIPKAGKPGEFRTLGIPTIYDRVCQQALLNRLEPIFEPIFDDANFGYRRGRSTYYQRAHVRKLFTQLDAWIVRRIWAHRCKRWRCSGWKQLPQTKLYGEMGLVSLLALHLRAPTRQGVFVKAACGKTARAV
jgi:RNA-directed DNA polymerase